MEVTSVDRPNDHASTTVKADDRDWLALVPRALGKAGISHKVAAAEMAIDPGLFSAQLGGAPGKHLSWLRMGKLPSAFWHEFVPLVGEFHRLTLGGSQQDVEDAAVGRLVREVVIRCR